MVMMQAPFPNHPAPAPPRFPRLCHRQAPVWKAYLAKPHKARYQYDINTARRELKGLVTNNLRKVTGNPYAEMVWTCEPITGLPKTIGKYGAMVQGWPRQLVRFEAPGHISSLWKLRELITGFRRGTIRFVLVDLDAYEQVVRHYGLRDDHASRADNMVIRNLRPLSTRSKRLRKGTTNKTAEWVDEPEDEIEEAVWPDDIPAAVKVIVDEIEEWQD